MVAFDGPVWTVRSPGDHGLARQLLEGPGDGAVLVVDGGGLLDPALVGDDMLAVAIDNGWAGIVVAGAVRDRALMERRPIGVEALGVDPRSWPRDGVGEVDLPETIGGVVIEPGRRLWADRDGIVSSERGASIRVDPTVLAETPLPQRSRRRCRETIGTRTALIGQPAPGISRRTRRSPPAAAPTSPGEARRRLAR